MKRKSNLLKWIIIFIFVLCLVSMAWAGDDCKAIYGNGSHRFSLATGSPGELGLLEKLG